MQKYLAAVKENICSICVDSSDKGKCTLSNKELCAVEFYLPQIVEIVHSFETDNTDDYYQKVRENICANCKEDEVNQVCELREDVNCSLDRYFPLIVDTVLKVDAEAA